MQLSIQTSSFDLVEITDFKYIYDLARCSKCKVFTMLKQTNKLYGSDGDCCTIHEIDIPFLINTDLQFVYDSDIDKGVVQKYNSFFVPEKFPWVILPSVYWEMYIGGDIYSELSIECNREILYDRTTKQPIDQIQMYTQRYHRDYQRNVFDNQLSNFLMRLYTLAAPHTFYNMEKDEMIRKVFDSKSIMGRFLCRFKNEYIDVAVYFYKGIFSLAKSDTLELDIRFDKFNTRQFMITYRPKKKKNPVSDNRYGVPYRESIHCMYVNLI